MKSYDLAIIGGGSAGLVAADTAHLFRKKTALIAIDKLGGDSLWYGCIPSKALLHSSRHGRSLSQCRTLQHIPLTNFFRNLALSLNQLRDTSLTLKVTSHNYETLKQTGKT